MAKKNNLFSSKEAMDDILSQIKAEMDQLSPSSKEYMELATTFNTLYSTKEKMDNESVKINNDAITANNREALEASKFEHEKVMSERRYDLDAKKHNLDVKRYELEAANSKKNLEFTERKITFDEQLAQRKLELDQMLAEDRRRMDKSNSRKGWVDTVVGVLTAGAGAGVYLAVSNRSWEAEKKGYMLTEPSAKTNEQNLNKSLFSFMHNRK